MIEDLLDLLGPLEARRQLGPAEQLAPLRQRQSTRETARRRLAAAGTDEESRRERGTDRGVETGTGIGGVLQLGEQVVCRGGTQTAVGIDEGPPLRRTVADSRRRRLASEPGSQTV